QSGKLVKDDWLMHQTGKALQKFIDLVRRGSLLDQLLHAFAKRQRIFAAQENFLAKVLVHNFVTAHFAVARQYGAFEFENAELRTVVDHRNCHCPDPFLPIPAISVPDSANQVASMGGRLAASKR